jgi:hypothetical protein
MTFLTFFSIGKISITLAVIILTPPTSMNIFSRILFWTGATWAVTCFLILTVGQYLPFEFANMKIAERFYGLVWCTFPIATLLTLVRQQTKRVLKVITVVVAIASLPILGLYAFGVGMCSYSTDNILFINKSDSSLKIIERHYGCGAYDSDLPKYEFFKMKYLTQQILYSKKIDTLLIDKGIWIRGALK